MDPKGDIYPNPNLVGGLKNTVLVKMGIFPQ